MRNGLTVALLTLLLDQLSKWMVLEHVFKPALGLPSLPLDEWYDSLIRLPYLQIEYLPFFSLTMVWNEGVGFGMLGGAGPLALMALAGVICVILLVWMYRAPDRYTHIALGLMIGGAIGNVIDRARLGAVIDFLDFHIAGWHYPAFNVADCGVVIGVLLLLLQPLFKGKVSGS